MASSVPFQCFCVSYLCSCSLGTHRHATFKTHDLSLYLGIRILTGEDWYQLMWDSAVVPPYCKPDLTNCGQSALSALYFLSFFFILFFIILNIFKAVLLEAFSVFYSEDDTKLNHTFLKRFRNHWSKFDPTAKVGYPLRRPFCFSQVLSMVFLLLHQLTFPLVPPPSSTGDYPPQASKIPDPLSCSSELLLV